MAWISMKLMSPKKLKSAMKNRENVFDFAVTFYIFTILQPKKFDIKKLKNEQTVIFNTIRI